MILGDIMKVQDGKCIFDSVSFLELSSSRAWGGGELLVGRHAWRTVAAIV